MMCELPVLAILVVQLTMSSCHQMLSMGTDQNVNPHDICSFNNRTSYEEDLAHSRGANMSQFVTHSKSTATLTYYLHDLTQVSGTPDPSLLSAFHMATNLYPFLFNSKLEYIFQILNQIVQLAMSSSPAATCSMSRGAPLTFNWLWWL